MDEELFEDLLNGGVEPAGRQSCRKALAESTRGDNVRQYGRYLSTREPAHLVPEKLDAWLKSGVRAVRIGEHLYPPLWDRSRMVLSLCDVIQTQVPSWEAVVDHCDLEELLHICRTSFWLGHERVPDQVMVCALGCMKRAQEIQRLSGSRRFEIMSWASRDLAGAGQILANLMMSPSGDGDRLCQAYDLVAQAFAHEVRARDTGRFEFQLSSFYQYQMAVFRKTTIIPSIVKYALREDGDLPSNTSDDDLS